MGSCSDILSKAARLDKQIVRVPDSRCLIRRASDRASAAPIPHPPTGTVKKKSYVPGPRSTFQVGVLSRLVPLREKLQKQKAERTAVTFYEEPPQLGNAGDSGAKGSLLLHLVRVNVGTSRSLFAFRSRIVFPRTCADFAVCPLPQRLYLWEVHRSTPRDALCSTTTPWHMSQSFRCRWISSRISFILSLAFCACSSD